MAFHDHTLNWNEGDNGMRRGSTVRTRLAAAGRAIRKLHGDVAYLQQLRIRGYDVSGLDALAAGQSLR